jgi:zinc protease
VVLDFPDAPNWQIFGDFLGPPPTDPDYAPLAVALKLLDRRLFREVRDARGLAYSVGASLELSRSPVGMLNLATSAPSEALSVVRRVISDLSGTPVDTGELTAASALLQSSVLAGGRTTTALASALGRSQLVMGDRSGVDDYLQALGAVTPDDARGALERYLRGVSLAAAGSGESLDQASLLASVSPEPHDAGASTAPHGGVDGSPDGARAATESGVRDAASDRADAGL